MTFLALAPWQVGLLCSLTAAAVIWLFFLKLRHPRVAVGSLLLWRRVLEDTQHRSLLERLRRLLSLLLALVIALSIAAAMGRPQSGALTGEPRDVALVLDASISMAAQTRDGRTRWAHARDAARQLIEAAGATDRFMVVTTTGRVATPLTSERAELFAALDSLEPSATRTSFPPVDAVGREIVFISDGVSPVEVPASVTVLSVFEAADNVAITNFEVRPGGSNPGSHEAYIEVRNYSAGTKDVALTMESRSAQLVAEVLPIAAESLVRGAFPLSGESGGRIQARIVVDGDALDVDDVAVDYVPPPQNVRAVLVTTGNEYLETVLDLDPRVELRVVQPDAFQEEDGTDVYIFDNFAPVDQPNRPALLFRPPGRGWLSQSDRAPALLATGARVTRWDAEHPILQFVSEVDLRITRARHLELAESPDVQVVAGAGQTPLIVAAHGSPKWVMVMFDLDDSDFAVRPGFPIFMQNVLTWFLGEPRALQRSVGTVEVPLRQATITTLEGAAVPSQPQFDSTRFETSAPGLFVASAGAARVHVAVNLGSPGASELNRTTLAEMELVNAPARRWLHRELWIYMLLIAIALATLEWWTYHRRITV